MKKIFNIQLRELNSTLVSQDYVNWMNNYTVTRYTEQRFVKNTKKKIIKFVKEKKNQKMNIYMEFFTQKKKLISEI